MGNDEPRMSAQTLKVLVTLLSSTASELSGADVGRASKLPSGTLYPILLRLERAGWLESRWEIEEAKLLGRPRRRLYRVTGVGAQKARANLKDFELPFGELSWSI